MKLTLLRHAQTEGSLRNLYYGAADIPALPESLSELHRRAGDYPTAQRYYTSGMLRTEQTLAAIYGDVPHTRLPGLREMDFGDFEMKSYDTLKDDPAYQTWITGDNEANVPPQGESGVQMTRRVLAAFSELPDGTALICHGGVIAAIMAACFPAEGKHRYQWQPLNGHGYELSGDTYRPIP